MGCASSMIEFTDVYEIDKGQKGPETQADVHTVVYFPNWDRVSPIQFLLSYCKMPFRCKEISIIEWTMGPAKRMYGQLPVVQRSNGTYMKETVPIARYIARHNSLYPTDDIEAWRCDFIIQRYQTVISRLNLHTYQTGMDALKTRISLFDEILPKFL